jgi:hypothetical protein
MVPRAATPQAAKAGAPWEHAGRMTSWEEGHGRGEQNLPTSVQSADADDDRAMLREAAYSAGGKRTLGKGKTKAPGRDAWDFVVGHGGSTQSILVVARTITSITACLAKPSRVSSSPTEAWPRYAGPGALAPGVHVRHTYERHRSARGGGVVRCQAPTGRGPIAVFV